MIAGGAEVIELADVATGADWEEEEAAAEDTIEETIGTEALEATPGELLEAALEDEPCPPMPTDRMGAPGVEEEGAEEGEESEEIAATEDKREDEERGGLMATDDDPPPKAEDTD